jgi:hypothetical protein
VEQSRADSRMRVHSYVSDTCFCCVSNKSCKAHANKEFETRIYLNPTALLF